MKDKSSRHLFLGLVLAVILGGIWQFVPLSDAKERLENLPLRGIGYEGVKVPLNEDEKKGFHDVNVLKRIYIINGQEYLVTVLDGTRNRHIVHDPYYCFKGGGWSVKRNQKISIAQGTASQLIISKNGVNREALFWFSDRYQHYASPLWYWMQASIRRLTLGALGEEPVLVVVQPAYEGAVDWIQFSRQFPALFSI